MHYDYEFYTIFCGLMFFTSVLYLLTGHERLRLARIFRGTHMLSCANNRRTSRVIFLGGEIFDFTGQFTTSVCECMQHDTTFV